MITREHCDACGGVLVDVFDLGEMPLANALLTADELHEPAVTYPLTVAECRDCSLVQLRHVVAPEVLYAGYRFFSGASSPNSAYFDGLAKWISARSQGNRVLEIGSNDGTLLAALERQNFDVTGIDPATAQCEQARKRLHRGRIECQFWGSDAAAEYHNWRFDVVVACNVLGHSNDLTDFVSSVKRVLNPNGLFVIEVQYLKSLLRQSAFENVYHEHQFVFDEISLSALLRRHGFCIHGWETTDAQCGTLRLWAGLSGKNVIPEAIKHDWESFRRGVRKRVYDLNNAVRYTKQDGRRVILYGSPAKATQIANYCNLTAEDIAFATDTTPAKQGLFIPGANIPIVEPSRMQPPDAAIVTAWNHWPHIAAKESAFVAAGGMLIKPTLDGLATAIASLERTSHARVGT